MGILIVHKPRQKYVKGKMSSHFSLFLLFLILLCIYMSCHKKSTINTSDFISTKICTLEQNSYQLGSPNSFAVVDDNIFAICDNSRVLLYDFSGEQIGQIGNSGRSKYEYLQPMIVRYNEGAIYVWSSLIPKIIKYSVTGVPLEEYDYQSGVTDFIPSDNYLFIYTSGKRGENVIDVYDTKNNTIKDAIIPSTDLHRLLTKFMSIQPFCTDKDMLYCMRKDALSIYSYDINQHKLDNSQAVFESDSFDIVDNEIEDDKFWSHYCSNSEVVLLIKDGKDFKVLTREGEMSYENKQLNKEKAFYSLYDVRNNRVASIKRFSALTSPNMALISFHEGKVYAIDHSIVNDDDVYSLVLLDM